MQKPLSGTVKIILYTSFKIVIFVISVAKDTESDTVLCFTLDFFKLF